MNSHSILKTPTNFLRHHKNTLKYSCNNLPHTYHIVKLLKHQLLNELISRYIYVYFTVMPYNTGYNPPPTPTKNESKLWSCLGKSILGMSILFSTIRRKDEGTLLKCWWGMMERLFQEFLERGLVRSNILGKPWREPLNGCLILCEAKEK